MKKVAAFQSLVLMVLMATTALAVAESDSDSDSVSASSSSRLPHNMWYPPWMAVGLTCIAVLLPACLLFTVFFCKGARTVNYAPL